MYHDGIEQCNILSFGLRMLTLGYNNNLLILKWNIFFITSLLGSQIECNNLIYNYGTV